MLKTSVTGPQGSRFPSAGDCPTCLSKLDGVTSTEVKPRLPEAGDLSICTYCGAILRFGQDLQLEPVTDDDMARLSEANRSTLREASQSIRRLNQVMADPNGPEVGVAVWPTKDGKTPIATIRIRTP